MIDLCIINSKKWEPQLRQLYGPGPFFEVWKKKEHSLRRGFITENEMSCGSPEAKSPEEQIAKAPKAMYTKEIWKKAGKNRSKSWLT